MARQGQIMKGLVGCGKATGIYSEWNGTPFEGFKGKSDIIWLKILKNLMQFVFLFWKFLHEH